MLLIELEAQIEKDLRIDRSDLGEASLRIPEIHNTYMKILMQEGTKLKKFKSDMKVLRRDLWLFYTGRASEEEYAKYPDFNPDMKILKPDLNMWIEADDRFVELQRKLDFAESKIELLEGVMRRINSRNFEIKNAIDWRKFCNGQ